MIYRLDDGEPPTVEIADETPAPAVTPHIATVAVGLESGPVTASVADGQLVSWPLKAEEWIAEGCGS